MSRQRVASRGGENKPPGEERRGAVSSFSSLRVTFDEKAFNEIKNDLDLDHSFFSLEVLALSNEYC